MRAGNDLDVGNVIGTARSLRFSRALRDKHLYVCGATGTGKSKFIENLVRQDIRGWFRSKCGLLLLDPHGSLYDSILGWLASKGAIRLPIILIDLRQDDWVISYNALRRRESSNCSVVIDNFVQAMAHVWGASGTDQTPRFARWASNILRTLYENGLTLLESEYLIDHLDREARYALLQKVEDRASRRDWQFANQLSPRDFESELGSTSNRLQRFLRNGHMRSMFGHGRASLDLRKALDEGYIILVSLACAGARVSEEDADLFATLLLSDLWTAALERGKRSGAKPFYLYLDEFQRFITPTIARNLDEARGFGLHLTMANQFPLQLLKQGVEGERLYHSVMENASSKAVFRLHSEENLRPMAEWLFRGIWNPDEIKLSLESTKVMGYREEVRHSRTTGTARTLSNTNTEGSTELSSWSEGESLSRSEGASFEAAGFHEKLGRSESSGKASLRSAAGAFGVQRSTARSEGETESESVTESALLVPVMGKELAHVQFRTLDEQLSRAMAALFEQEQRQGVVRLAGMKAPVSIHTPTVRETAVRPERVKAYVDALLSKWDFALPREKAKRQLAEREKEIELQLRQSARAGEPETYRRKVAP